MKGILSRLGNLHLNDCKIHGFKAGGVLVESKQSKNKVSINNCKIIFNDIVGVHFTGEDCPTIEKYKLLLS